MLPIRLIYQNLEKYNQSIVQVQGWVKSIRKSKKITFVSLNDGSAIDNLQIIFDLQRSFQEEVGKINFGGSLIVSGKLILTPQREQKCELEAREIIFISSTDSNYPFQKKYLPLEVVRNYLHLRAKTNYFSTMFRLRSIVSSLIHDFFQTEGFYYVHTPLITASDTEGAGELFTLTTNNESKTDFFGKSAKLTVSGQLQAEALTQGLGKVYTFSPCFRAEKSHTTRHLAEFWMIEPELVFGNLEEIIDLAEKLVKYVINHLIVNNYKELEYFEKYTKKRIVEKLKNIANQPFQKITYKEAIELLTRKKEIFTCQDICWGMDLQSEHEKYLTEYFNKPVFVVDYPIKIKAFYMKNNKDEETVACMDLLLPGIGELIGGSVREDDCQVLEEKIKKNGLDLNSISWYLDLRKYGYSPSAGFGLGLERLLMFLTGTENIRDTIPFPRYPKHLEF